MLVINDNIHLEVKMWIENLYDEEFIGPFEVEEDQLYRADLQKRYRKLYYKAKSIGADVESVKIIDRYTKRILDAVTSYYKGRVTTCFKKIKNLITDCVRNDNYNYAVCSIDAPNIIPSENIGTELQLFRSRQYDDIVTYSAKDMLHRPYNLRAGANSYRFSIPGVPSLYLANSSYCCWLEARKPPEYKFNVSPALLDGEQMIFDLVVSIFDIHSDSLRQKVLLKENDLNGNIDRIHTWLKLIIFMIATSYRVKEKGRVFKSEYVISQAIMVACCELKLDGVAYYSKRVESDLLANAAINFVLFAPYRYGKEYGEICEHLKISSSFNYMSYKQISISPQNFNYRLRSDYLFDQYISNDRHIEQYKETYFYWFDKYMFYQWERQGKDSISFGNALKNNE